MVDWMGAMICQWDSRLFVVARTAGGRCRLVPELVGAADDAELDVSRADLGEVPGGGEIHQVRDTMRGDVRSRRVRGEDTRIGCVSTR